MTTTGLVGGERRPLTAIAQEAIAGVLFDGALAVDATMGNGHDTVFMAEHVGPTGQVFAFDIQTAALSNTAQRIEQAGLDRRVELKQAGHEDMIDAVPASWRGRVNAVMFNLGYLPGGDKHRVTVATTTCRALDGAIKLLNPFGRLSILLYRHHEGADEEARAVTQWLAGLPDDYRVESHESPGPVLHLVTRRAKTVEGA